jgi:hypothetical protein
MLLAPLNVFWLRSTYAANPRKGYQKPFVVIA